MTARRQRRRGIVVLGASLGLSAAMLLAWLPASALVAQRHTIATTASRLHQLQRQDRTLASEQAALSDPSTVGRVARQQYQLEQPGVQSYEVLPPAKTPGAGQYAGDPGLQPPVVPGSGSGELLQPSSTGSAARSSATTAPRRGVAGTSTDSSRGTGAASGPSLLQRIERTLEFWR